MNEEELNKVLEHIEMVLQSLIGPVPDDKVAIECYILRCMNMLLDIKNGRDYEHFQRLWRVDK